MFVLLNREVHGECLVSVHGKSCLVSFPCHFFFMPLHELAWSLHVGLPSLSLLA